MLGWRKKHFQAMSNDRGAHGSRLHITLYTERAVDWKKQLENLLNYLDGHWDKEIPIETQSKEVKYPGGLKGGAYFAVPLFSSPHLRPSTYTSGSSVGDNLPMPQFPSQESGLAAVQGGRLKHEGRPVALLRRKKSHLPNGAELGDQMRDEPAIQVRRTRSIGDQKTAN